MEANDAAAKAVEMERPESHRFGELLTPMSPWVIFQNSEIWKPQS